MELQRYAIELAYNGRDFFGWQIQPKQVSVQETIELALSRLFDAQKIDIVGCGRTDTGVHAKHYIAHVDLPLKWDEDVLTYKLNRILPASIVIYNIQKKESDFHARFNAKARTYRYFIHTQKDPFINGASLHFTKHLNLVKMNEAGLLLLGKKDFTSFSKLHTDVFTNICLISHAAWTRVNEHEIYFEITADRFLRNMVRAIVGTLLEVGEGKITSEDLKTIIAKNDRGEAKMSVPAHGLFLWKIEY
jgi:tRNA pseudouridine38-40 synthase